MQMILLVAVGLLQSASPDLFTVQTEIQGIYDELSQAALQSVTDTDIDDFHEVFCTQDWQFVDAKGQRHAWQEMREQAVQALKAPPLASMVQRIRKVSLVPGGATVVVSMTTVRTVIDNDGRYGRKDEPHALAETTLFRDSWVLSGDKWKLKSREQIGLPTVSVDRPVSE